MCRRLIAMYTSLFRTWAQEEYADKAYLHPLKVDSEWTSIKESLIEVNVFFSSLEVVTTEEVAVYSVRTSEKEGYPLLLALLQRPLLGRPQSSSESRNRHETRSL